MPDLSEQDLLQQMVQNFRQMGLRRSEKFEQWADYRFGLLKDFTIKADWQRLERMGVTRECMAIAMMLINIAPHLDYLFKQHFDNKRQRQAKADALLAAIPVVEEIGNIWEEELLETAPKEFVKAWEPLPSSVIKCLREWANFILMGDTFLSVLEANSILEVAKYGLAGLVRRVTAGFHDREVAALTGAALQKEDYDETTHRVWRIRNYKRFEQTMLWFLPVALQALNIVLVHPSDIS